MTHTLDTPTTAPADPATDPAVGGRDQASDTPAAPGAVVIELTAEQVAQHPDNIRDAGRGIRELAASIAEVGVLVPAIVVPVDAVPGHDFGPAVTHVAVDGNRRQAAARAAGMPLPCIVRPDLTSAREHALTMAVTGLARDGLTAREEAGAVQTMLDLGIDAAAIGRATGRTRKQVTAARKAATLTDQVTATVADYPLTLGDLAALAQWQHDPDAIDTLVQAIRHGQLDHELARLTLARRERTARDKTARDLTDQGITVTDIEPRYHGDGPRRLTQLRHPDAPAGRALTPTDHATCPGHVAHVEVTIYPADPEQGSPEDTEVTLTYGCTDPAGHGHLDLWSGRSPRPSALPALPEQDAPDGEDEQARADRLARQEQARADAEAAAAQQARDARRELIRLNKEADAAQVVRREFLRSCLSAKPRHKAMTAYAFAQLLGRSREVTAWLADHQHHLPPVLAEILGEDPVPAALAASTARQPVMLWAYVAAAHEAVLHRDSHRDHHTARANYLRHLIDLGYAPADVERRIITAVYPDPTPTPLIDLDLSQEKVDSEGAGESEAQTGTESAVPVQADADPAGTAAGEVMPATAA